MCIYIGNMLPKVNVAAAVHVLCFAAKQAELLPKSQAAT